MTAQEFLAAAETLPFANLDGILRGRGVVVIAPHPDDESLGCAGLIAQQCARDGSIRLVVISDGTGSHPNSPSYPPARLRSLREQETVEAVRVLGLEPQHVTFLRLPDRFVPHEGSAAEAAAERVADIARECAAGTLVVTWSHDPHCDHAASAAIARLARAQTGARLLEYPVWGWSLPPETEVGVAPRGVRLDISDQVAMKRAAIEAHRSQTTSLINDDPDGFQLDAGMLARFARPFEIYLEVE